MEGQRSASRGNTIHFKSILMMNSVRNSFYPCQPVCLSSRGYIHANISYLKQMNSMLLPPIATEHNSSSYLEAVTENVAFVTPCRLDNPSAPSLPAAS